MLFPIRRMPLGFLNVRICPNPIFSCRIEILRTNWSFWRLASKCSWKTGIITFFFKFRPKTFLLQSTIFVIRGWPLVSISFVRYNEAFYSKLCFWCNQASNRNRALLATAIHTNPERESKVSDGAAKTLFWIKYVWHRESMQLLYFVYNAFWPWAVKVHRKSRGH